MRTTNLFILRGFVGNAPKQVGKSVKVSVATHRKNAEGTKETDWVEVTILNEKIMAWVLENVKNGDPVYAECRVRSGSYKGKTGETIYSTDVIANLFDSLVPNQANEAQD